MAATSIQLHDAKMTKSTILGLVVAFMSKLCHASILDSHVGLRLASRQSSAPSRKAFVRRADAAATIVGDYLYIVGGGVSQMLDGEDEGDEAYVMGVNVTLTLPLNKSWKSQDIDFGIIEAADFPTAIGHALWANEDDGEIVYWGGLDFGSDRTGSTVHKLWTLATDGEGGGKWTATTAPEKIKRTAFGAYASCGGVGYFAGGLGAPTTDANVFQSRIAVPGLVSYDFTTGTWGNVTTKGLTDSGAFQKGKAVCVEIEGQKPKLFVIGGAEPTLTDVADGTATVQSFDNAFWWDTDKKQWFEQETQGERPTGRQGSCAVGAAGPNGTYDIFMYGGFSPTGLQDDVWVLSLPAFRWFKASVDSTPRLSHDCVRVGSQMVVVGGNDDPIWNADDKFQNGIGVFNLNSLSWEESFDADSAAYEGPSAVREWYAERGYDTIPWFSDEVKQSFLGNTDGEDEDTASPSTTPEPSDTDEPPSNTVVIAAGVVAGIVGLAMLGFFIWFWRRRRGGQTDAHERLDETDEGYAYAMKPTELPTDTVAEMDGSVNILQTSPSELESPHPKGGWKRQSAVELPA